MRNLFLSVGLGVGLVGCGSAPASSTTPAAIAAAPDARANAVVEAQPVEAAPAPSSPTASAPMPNSTPAAPPGMVLVSAGPYWTGCDLGKDTMCRQDEGAWRQVTLDDYYIDIYETTVDAYTQCVKEGACDDRHMSGFEGKGGEWNESQYCNYAKPGKGNHPINCVGWYQADAFCKWTGKRLPTEAEWEKAARGTDKRRYPWGDEALTCEYAVTNEANDQTMKGCGVNSTFPVGSKPKGVSPYGVHDIVGNVWEWTADWYDPTYKLGAQPASNPTGPASGTHKIGKGGCWGSGNPWNSRVSWRHHYAPTYRSNVRLGFRCAMSAPQTNET